VIAVFTATFDALDHLTVPAGLAARAWVHDFIAMRTGATGISGLPLGTKAHGLIKPGRPPAPSMAPAEWLDGMARLRVAPVPPGIAEARWTKIVETADDLLERWGGQLAALGWTAADVLGSRL
jgi:hypothetical protein